jgi:ribosomal protein S19
MNSKGLKHDQEIVPFYESLLIMNLISIMAKKYIGLKVTNDMLGHKFGEFASTRRYGIKKKKKGKK